MKQNTNSFYILQVSDFHISEDSKNNADAALKAVTDKISEMNINIKYLNGHYIREKVVYLSNDIPMVKGTIINFLTDGKNVMSNKVLT